MAWQFKDNPTITVVGMNSLRGSPLAKQEEECLDPAVMSSWKGVQRAWGILGFSVTPILGGYAAAENWPQFRGPDGLGVAAVTAQPPSYFGPNTNIVWKAPVPAGNSSPITWGNQLFLTAFAEGKLLVLAYDCDSGREMWRRELAPESVEEVHRSLGSPASATPITDGHRLYVHFGSLGVVAFDLEGDEMWRRPMRLTETEYGASSSPVLSAGNVIQLLDQDGGSHLVAVNQQTGEIAWRVERPEMRRGFGTPLVWNHHGRTDLVAPGTIWLIGYDPRTGDERWRVSGLARISCTSPAVGDGLLFAASWTTGGDQSADRITMPPFDEFAAQYDSDHDGRFTFAELPEGAAKQRFKHLDGNRSGYVERSEWESMAAIFERVENQAFAVKPDANGGISDAGVSWRLKRGLPYVASPLFYGGHFYMVKNGGLLTCIDPKSGKPSYLEERLGAVGDYYASLIGADGRVFVCSQPGVITVVAAGPDFRVLARNDMTEAVQATPAVIGDTLYVRTATQLFAFRDLGPSTVQAK